MIINAMPTPLGVKPQKSLPKSLGTTMQDVLLMAKTQANMMRVPSMKRIIPIFLICQSFSGLVWAQAPQFEPAKPVNVKPEDLKRFEKALRELDQTFNRSHSPIEAKKEAYPPGWADAEIGRKGLRWILQYNEFYNPKFVSMTDKVVELTRQRAKSLSKPAELKKGFGTALGYISDVDGSVQPFALYVPPDADLKKPGSLLVVLHGRNQTLNEVSFIDAHQGKPYPKSELENGMKRYVLHVYGRTNNAYRWAGEADVFEALGQALTRVAIDPRKIDLQGFSMGGAGAWHLGLHHPIRWRTFEAGAGFNETRNYARLKETSPWVDKLLHIYDAYEVARNVTAVPAIGYGGEEDPQLKSSTNVVEQLRKEGFKTQTEGLLTKVDGLDFMQVVGAKMGHKVDPASRKVMDEFVKRVADGKISRNLQKIDMVTYTLRYNEFGWVMLEGLDEHYRKTWVQAHLTEDGKTAVFDKLENVSAFRQHRASVQTVRIGDQSFKVPASKHVFVKKNDVWEMLTGDAETQFAQSVRKRPGLQGPIDDAFMDRFVVVGPQGGSNQPEQKLLDTFTANWSKFMRGDLPTTTADSMTFQGKDPSEIGPWDNLVLFGSPKSNPLIAKILPKLSQIQWSDSEFTLGGKTYSTKENLPVLIAPNPLNPKRYVVINSGHTFGRKDFEGTNALLFSKMGDWGVLKVKPDGSTEVVDSGFFNELWESDSR